MKILKLFEIAEFFFNLNKKLIRYSTNIFFNYFFNFFQSKTMEIETTYDEFLNFFPSVKNDFSKIIPKVFIKIFFHKY